MMMKQRTIDEQERGKQNVFLSNFLKLIVFLSFFPKTRRDCGYLYW